MIAGLQQADKNLFQKATLINLFAVLFGYRQHLRVVGKSMEPTLFDGDLIIYKKTTSNISNLKVGDIVVAIHPSLKDKLLIKRVCAIHLKGIDLRGDNVNSSTDSRNLGLLKSNQIIGIIEKIIPN